MWKFSDLMLLIDAPSKQATTIGISLGSDARRKGTTINFVILGSHSMPFFSTQPTTLNDDDDLLQCCKHKQTNKLSSTEVHDNILTLNNSICFSVRGMNKK